MDRNLHIWLTFKTKHQSLSARRAWIEIFLYAPSRCFPAVALRKESVDRNKSSGTECLAYRVALRKESVDRNYTVQIIVIVMHGRSPQGERG